MSKEYYSFREVSYRYRRHAFYYILLFATVAVFLVLFYEPIPQKINNIPIKKPSIVEKSPENWDAIDGVGYKFDTNQKTKNDPRYEILNNLPKCESKPDDSKISKATKIMAEFQSCINPIVLPMRGNVSQINLEWVKKTAPCDKLSVFESLKIVEMPNLHEIKWTILPTCKENNTMLTLGIGHDTTAEEKLNRTVPNTVFYGADPIIDPNRQLYSSFGRFFPFAVGRKAGMTKFRILPNQNQKTRKYIYQDVTTIDITYFLHDILNLKRIDIAWIDIEGGEFEFLDFFQSGGRFDQYGITICQFNLEVHSKFHPPGAQIFHDFIFRTLEDKRYIFLKPMNTDKGVHRMFFVNLEDKECIAKFL